MILVSDSGSTKADWIAGSGGKVTGEFTSKGFNPFFHDQQFVLNELSHNKPMNEIKEQVSQLYFFGAGCSSPERNEIIRKALAAFFVNAEVVVDHDMLGCALAVCDGKPGVAAILGTGSNICYFDGKNISDTRHGLGYVIGDEGSGSYYGKKLTAYFLYKIMPDDLSRSFFEYYGLSKEDIIRKVYSEPNPNVFLASFARFLSEHQSHPYIKNMVHKGMREFFETNVMSYPESKSVPVHFVGSIAHYFRDVLEAVAAEFKVTTGNIIQKPVSGLAQYFLSGGKMP